MLQQVCGGLGEERLEVAVQGLVEGRGRSVVVHPRASLRLWNDLFDDTHREQVARGQLELLGRLHLTGVVAPHDRGRGLRRCD